MGLLYYLHRLLALDLSEGHGVLDSVPLVDGALDLALIQL
jgi:hypothetical protein